MVVLLRVVIAAAIIGLLLFWMVGGGFSSPKENLVQSVIGMCDGFNAQDAGDVLVHCSDNFRENEYFLDASSFRGALLRIFFTQRDGADGSFLWRALVVEEEIQIELQGPEEEARVATVSVPVRFVKSKSPQGRVVWTLRIDGLAQKEPDGRWRFIEASFKTISGRRPF
ncbi:MAG: hypothetical protein VX764_04860 [Planctomycetota bacterium]|nr:hypothetical protein [Planctomycetota bacterium]